MVEDSGRFDALLQEDRTFPPSQAFIDQANISDPGVYEEALRDPEAFWAKFAEELDWFKKWDTVLEWDPPHAKWFIGGRLNVSYNCLDRHLTTSRRNKAAIVWEGEPGDRRVYTYWDLYREVCQFANGLKSLGVKKGDRVTIYLPMVPNYLSPCWPALVSGPPTASCSAGSAPSPCATGSTTPSPRS